MTKTLERELKFVVDDGFELPELPGAPLEPRHFVSTYLDTPGLRLAAAGITLRRRFENGRNLWQLKLPRGGDDRLEAGRLEVLRHALRDHLVVLDDQHLRHRR